MCVGWYKYSMLKGETSKQSTNSISYI